jgi:uncharacterized membrane protein HdeD (DUF308 family)
MTDARITREDIREITWAWWVLVLLGILGIVAGAIVIAKPSHSLTTLAIVCGIFVLIDSIFELVIALFTEHSGVAALLGVLGLVIGILLVRHPVHSVLAVALLIGIWLVAIGVVRLVRAIATENRRWNVVVAVLEIIAGIVIVSSPHIGFTALALLVGISFIVNGLALAALGWLMQRFRRAADGLVTDRSPAVGTPTP